MQFRFSGYAGLLGKGHLMSAMEMVIERERSVRLGFFAERVQELDNLVSRYRPMLCKRDFHFLRNATDAEDRSGRQFSPRTSRWAGSENSKTV